MFFLAWFHHLVYFRALHRALEVKGLRMGRVWQWGEMIFLLALGPKGSRTNEEGAESHALTQSYTAELNFNLTFKFFYTLTRR